MNIHEALATANWLLSQSYVEDRDAEQVLRLRKLRDVLYFLHAAAGVPEMRLEAYELGLQDGREE